jgi:ADP-ribose pyrophosphatase
LAAAGALFNTRPSDLEPRTETPAVSDAHSSRRLIYRGVKIDLALQQVVRTDGTTAEREIVIHRGAVALLPMVDDHHVCLIQNQRFAVGKTLIEVPAGTIDEGETPAQTAERELVEETGYRAGRIRQIREWYVSPGFLTERMYLFLCDDLKPGPPRHEPDEKLEPMVVPWEQALAMVDDGRIEDAKTLLALTIWARMRARPDFQSPAMR